MDETSQSMRVSVTEEQSGRVVVDGSTEDGDERSVHLDTIELSSTKAYIIKYEFFEKNVNIRSYEDKIVSGAHMGASSCSKPFVVQELAITAKELTVQRAQKYRDLRASTSSEAYLGPKEHDLSELPRLCDFSLLNNTIADMKDGERGLYCTRATFTYSLVAESPQELNKIFEKSFTIAGANKESVTYLFDLTLGFDFATSAQLKAVLRRVDAGVDEQEFVYDPLACLYDHSCIESELVGKNELNIDVILTSGDYKLTIFDQQENSVRKWISNQAGLSSVPFTFELQAVPIIQNEERVMCGDKLFLTELFI